MKCRTCNKEGTFVAPFLVTLRVTVSNGKFSSVVGKGSLLTKDCHCWLCGSSDLEMTDQDKQRLLDEALGEF